MKNKNKKINGKKGPLSKWENYLLIYILFLVIVPAVLYHGVVHFGYSELDDTTIIMNINKAQENPFNLKEAFSLSSLMGDTRDSFYRPMQTISFMLDAELGGKEPWIYHLSNLILHILTTVALFFFLNMNGIKRRISFILALFFSIHPLFTNAVAWIPARGDILLCLFSLLSIMTFIEYFKTKKTVYLILHIIVFLAAVFAKETAVLLPVLILSYYYFVQKKKIVLKDILPILIVWLISFLTYFGLRQNVIKISPSSNVFGIIPFIKNLPAIPITFCKFFFPYNLCTMPFFDTAGLIGGIILLIIFAVLTVKAFRGERRIVIWGWGWFLAFSVPSMFFKSYFATIGFDYFEYRAYLPIIGILLIIGILINELSAIIFIKRIKIISIPLFIIYCIISFTHMEDFADPISFFSSAIKTNSNNAFALGERGTALFYQGSKEKAIEDFENSIKANPTYPMPYFNEGLIYSGSKDHKMAEYYFTLALHYDTLSPDIHLFRADTYENLSLEKNFLGKYDETKTILKKGISIYPDSSKLHNILGLAYFHTSKFDSAFFEYGRAIESDKGIFSYYNNRGLAEYYLNNFSSALNDFNIALELKPKFYDALGNRGMAKIKLKDYEGALNDLTKSISIKKDVGMVWYYRGITFYKLNKQAEAEANWAEAKKLGFREPIGEK
jgi:protein O-mannosyl-transferase